MGLAN